MRLHEPVIDPARAAPDALAVADPDGTLACGRPDTLADRYAQALHACGLSAGDRVVLWTGKSVHAVAARQGAPRAGVVHAPVTSTNPVRRVARAAVDRGAALIVAGAEPVWRVHASGQDISTWYSLPSAPSPTAHMAVGALHTVDALTLTPNGKKDCAAMAAAIEGSAR